MAHMRKHENDVMIVAKQNKLGIKMAKKLEKLLIGHGMCIHFDRSTALRLRKHGVSINKFAGNFIITLGGDGTFLRAAHQANVPILPVKIEGHGFLCTCTFKELANNIRNVIKGKYDVTERMRLRCIVEKKGIFDKILNKPYPQAVNEIVFGRKRPSKILDIEFRIDGVAFSFVGDGVMFATPAGSTAYSASAGGSIIDPSLEVISIIPLYPFYSSIKPKIIPAGKSIEVSVRNAECALIIDGHGGEYVKKGSKFIIEKGDPVKVIDFMKYDFYKKLKKECIG